MLNTNIIFKARCAILATCGDGQVQSAALANKFHSFIDGIANEVNRGQNVKRFPGGVIIIIVLMAMIMIKNAGLPVIAE